jgi:hypothetical protein
MKPLPATPQMRTLLTGEIQIIWNHLEKKGSYSQQHYTTNSEVEAGIVYMNKTALWILQPLASWLRSQEHVCSVMQVSNAGRAKYVGKMHGMVNGMIANNNTMPGHVADWLNSTGLEMYNMAMPGKSSRFFEGSIQLRIYLQAFAEKYATGQKVPQP